MAGRAPMLWIWYWVTAAMVQPSWTTGTTARSARSAATRLPHRVQPARRGAECEYLADGRDVAAACAPRRGEQQGPAPARQGHAERHLLEVVDACKRVRFAW